MELYNGHAGCSIRMKASVSPVLSDMSLPSWGERKWTVVGVQPNVCPSPACAPAPDTGTEHAVPSLMMSKYLAAL